MYVYIDKMVCIKKNNKKRIKRDKNNKFARI